MRTAWESLCEDTGGAVYVVDADGVILYSNAAARNAPASVRSAPDPGRPLAEVFGPDLARERQELIVQALTTGRPVALEGMVQGGLVRTTFRPLEPEGGERLVLMVAIPASQFVRGRDGPALVRAKCNDAGELARLTARETEILRLIGQGMSTSEIAEALHRSVKTVEWHRVSLGNKLGVSNRVELARIAIGAGLVALNAPEGTSAGKPRRAE